MSRCDRRGRHRRRPARLWIGALLATGAAAVTAAPGAARADTIDATSTTLVSGRQDPRDGVVHTTVPVFELVSLRATDIRLRGVDDLNVIMSGWGEVTLTGTDDGKHGFGDLDIAYVEGKLGKRRLTVRLGRQMLVAGAGRNLAFDGANVTLAPVRWAGLSAQAGVPVTPRFAVHRGDFMFGGRAFFKPGFDSEAGVSFLQVLDHGDIARQDLAGDARFVLPRLSAVSLTGFVRYSLYDERVAEAQATATGQLSSKLEVTAGYRRTAPDLFLPRNSIFSVFSQETRDEVGAYFYVRLCNCLRLQGDYHVILDEQGTGHDASAKLTHALFGDNRDSVGVEARLLVLPGDHGYTMGRLFALGWLAPRVLATLDASAFFFEGDVNGHDRSFNGAATVSYDFKPGWRAQVVGIGSVTPFAERRFEAMAKLAYQFSHQIRQVRP